MEINEFWKLIDKAKRDPSKAAEITKALAKLPPARIIAFEQRLRDELHRACTHDMIVACFLVESYISDDVFEDFCAFVLLQGRERFENAIRDPSTICDWLTREAADDLDAITGEPLLFVAADAYEEHGGDDDITDHTHEPDTPDIEVDWPDDRDAFRAASPRLFDQFYNQQRIDEIHG